MFRTLGKISCRDKITTGLFTSYKINYTSSTIGVTRVNTNIGLHEVNKSKTYQK